MSRRRSEEALNAYGRRFVAGATERGVELELAERVFEQVRGFEPLARFAPMRSEIEAFWRVPAHREVASWREHEDINDVMLATSLLPNGFLRVT